MRRSALSNKSMLLSTSIKDRNAAGDEDDVSYLSSTMRTQKCPKHSGHHIINDFSSQLRSNSVLSCSKNSEKSLSANNKG